jgi:hypothetical protein
MKLEIREYSPPNSKAWKEITIFTLILIICLAILCLFQDHLPENKTIHKENKNLEQEEEK